MELESMRIYKYSFSLFSPFEISYDRVERAEGLIVEVSLKSGVRGYGEASPSPKITGSTIVSTIGILEMMARRLKGKEISPEEFRLYALEFPGTPEAKTALEIAFLDAWAKEIGAPLYKILGGGNKAIITDMTIGLKSVDEAVSEAIGYVEEGFRILKIKLGGPVESDVERVKRIRDAVGPDISLRLDVNQAWSPKSAVKAIKDIERYEPELIEQPLPKNLIEENSILRRNTSIRIALDESVHDLNDAYRVVVAEAADVINVKLMKTGGLLEALRIIHLSEAAGVENMIGCMVETRLGITAASHLAVAADNIKYVDLDSDLMIHGESPVKGGSIHIGAGVRKIEDRPGLGVKIDTEKLELVREL